MGNVSLYLHHFFLNIFVVHLLILILLQIDEKYFRPAEVELLLGDPSQAEKDLGWKRKVSFKQLVSDMVKYDLENNSFGGKE